MSLDARIESIARQIIAESGMELGRILAHLESLHTELHAVATRVAVLEQRMEPKTGGIAQSAPDAAPRTGRPRKVTGE